MRFQFPSEALQDHTGCTEKKKKKKRILLRNQEMRILVPPMPEVR